MEPHNQGSGDPVANYYKTRSAWEEFLHEYFHNNVIPKDTCVINVVDDAPLTQPEDVDVVLALCQPGQRDRAKTQEERTELGLAAQPMGRTFYSEKNVPSAGYKMPLPPPVAGSNSKMLAAADPLQLSIGAHAPAANHMPGSSSSSIAFNRYMGSGINNLKLLPPEKKTVTIPNNASPSLTTKKPYELPLLGLIGKKKDPPPFAPVILESSQVAVLPSSVNMAPAKAKHKRRRYIWPASMVARIDEKIEQLRKEALLKPAHRSPMILIEKDIDELQGKKDEMHARMLTMMREDDDADVGGSTQ